jgi:hypothetical protein
LLFLAAVRTVALLRCEIRLARIKTEAEGNGVRLKTALQKPPQTKNKKGTGNL